MARVAGQSLLEYLPQERDAQRAIVIRCMEEIPASVEALIEHSLL